MSTIPTDNGEEGVGTEMTTTRIPADDPNEAEEEAGAEEKEPKTCCQRVIEFLKEKWWFVACYLIVFVVIGFGIYHIVDGADYVNNATEEMCLLLDFESANCEFRGDPDDDECCCAALGDDSFCDCYDGTMYRYTATAEGKCGDTELFSDYSITETCPGTLREMNQEYVCYVLDCEEQEFALSHPASTIGHGVLLIFIGLAIGCCPCICILVIKCCCR